MQPNELRIQFKVSEWLAMAGVNLDSYNNSLFHKKDIYRKCYTRTTGVGIYMDYEFKIYQYNSALHELPVELCYTNRLI